MEPAWTWQTLHLSLLVVLAANMSHPSAFVLVPSRPGGGSFGDLQQFIAQLAKHPLRQWSRCCHMHSLSLWEMTLYLISFRRRTCDSSCVTSSEITEHFAVSIANRAFGFHCTEIWGRPRANLLEFLSLLHQLTPLSIICLCSCKALLWQHSNCLHSSWRFGREDVQVISRVKIILVEHSCKSKLMFVVSVDTLKLVRLFLNESGSVRLKFKVSFPMNLINFIFKDKQSLGYSRFLPLY